MSSYTTSYVPNPTSGTMLREADNFPITDSALLTALFGADRTAWTVATFVKRPSAVTNDARLIYIGTTDYSRRVDVYWSDSTTSLVAYIADGAYASITSLGTYVGGDVKCAISCDGANIRISVNGAAVVTIASVFGGAAMINVVCPGHSPGPVMHLDGTVVTLSSRPTALTGAALQALTV